MAVRAVPVRLDLAAVGRVADRVEDPRFNLGHRRPRLGRSMLEPIRPRLPAGVAGAAAQALRIARLAAHLDTSVTGSLVSTTRHSFTAVHREKRSFA